MERRRYQDDDYLDDPDLDDDLGLDDDEEPDSDRTKPQTPEGDLEDIENPREPELQDRSLEDINVRIIPGSIKPPDLPGDADMRIVPGQPVPPSLQ